MQKTPRKEWIIREDGYQPAKADAFGSKLLIGNGYMGYRGTLEEHEASALVA
jgi:trehalose/maltose hydrolase-like predicted phosphorylase